MTPSSPPYALVGANSRPIPFPLEAVPQTPVGPEARIAGAAREAWPTAQALRAHTLAQQGYDPILVVCAVDAPIGRQLVERAFGPLLPASLCGPVVLPIAEVELLGAFGPQVAKALEDELATLAAERSELRLLFAVNAMGIDLRVLRALPPAPAPVAAPAPATTQGGSDTHATHATTKGAAGARSPSGRTR